MTNLQCSDMNFMLPNKQINDASSPNVTPTDGNGEKKKNPKKKEDPGDIWWFTSWLEEVHS